MASSEVQICNSALIKVGAEPIEALTDETKSARLCRHMYPILRDEVLISHPWNFAIARKVLAASATAPLFGYAYQYPLSTDILRVLEINDQDYSSDWKVEGRVIVTDLSEMKVKYIKQVTDVSKFTFTFAEVLALRIAWDLAFPLVQSTALRDQMKKDYNDMLGQARSFDAQEGGRIDQVGADEWLNARR